VDVTSVAGSASRSRADRLPRRMFARKLSVAAAALLAMLALSACGESHSRVVTGTYAGESGANAPYLDVGPLIYEVQLSRELNPSNTEDASYLRGLSAEQRQLKPGEEWFAVFVEVFNNSSRELPAAKEISIADTQGNVYTPLAQEEVNPFTYRGGMVPAKGQLPSPGTTAADGPTQGALLLFKIQVVSLDNRPLELKIVDPSNPAQTASAELDV
jgi:hypothetical protein